MGALHDTGHPRKERHDECRAAARLEDILPPNASQALERRPAFAEIVDRHPVRPGLRVQHQAPTALIARNLALQADGGLENRAGQISNITYTAPTETGEAQVTVDEASIGRAALGGGLSAGAAAFARVGRNDPCPCGSGKKYKHCHGKLT